MYSVRWWDPPFQPESFSMKHPSRHSVESLGCLWGPSSFFASFSSFYLLIACVLSTFAVRACAVSEPGCVWHFLLNTFTVWQGPVPTQHCEGNGCSTFLWTLMSHKGKGYPRKSFNFQFCTVMWKYVYSVTSTYLPSDFSPILINIYYIIYVYILLRYYAILFSISMSIN